MMPTATVTITDAITDPKSSLSYGGDGGIHYNGAQSDSVPLRIVSGWQPNPGIAISGSPNH
jgi:hypothetical protein